MLLSRPVNSRSEYQSVLPQQSKSSKKEEHYQYLVSILKSINVDTIEKAQTHIKGLQKKALHSSAIPLALLVIAWLLAPQFLFFWGLITLFALAWIWSSTLATHQMIKRYIEQELK